MAAEIPPNMIKCNHKAYINIGNLWWELDGNPTIVLAIFTKIRSISYLDCYKLKFTFLLLP